MWCCGDVSGDGPLSSHATDFFNCLIWWATWWAYGQQLVGNLVGNIGGQHWWVTLWATTGGQHKTIWASFLVAGTQLSWYLYLYLLPLSAAILPPWRATTLVVLPPGIRGQKQPARSFGRQPIKREISDGNRKFSINVHISHFLRQRHSIFLILSNDPLL